MGYFVDIPDRLVCACGGTTFAVAMAVWNTFVLRCEACGEETYIEPLDDQDPEVSGAGTFVDCTAIRRS